MGWMRIQTEHELPAHFTPDLWFQGIFASNSAIPHQSVTPAKINPAPTNPLNP
jgi:hypothetical protein